MTTITEAFAMGWSGRKAKDKKIVLPAVIALAGFLRVASDWSLPCMGLGCLVWAGFLVAAPLGLAALGVSFILLRLGLELTRG